MDTNDSQRITITTIRTVSIKPRGCAPDWIKLAKNWERERERKRETGKKETITFERLWWNWPVDSIRMNIAERWYKGVSQLRQARMGPLFGRESRDISSLRPDEHRWPRWFCGHARDKDQESRPRDELSHCVPHHSLMSSSRIRRWSIQILLR